MSQKGGEQALPLAKQVRTLIIPPHSGHQLLNDPRVDKLIEQTTNALFVLPEPDHAKVHLSEESTNKNQPQDKITYLLNYHDLITLSQQLSQHLSQA